jgi:hypothetical protein
MNNGSKNAYIIIFLIVFLSFAFAYGHKLEMQEIKQAYQLNKQEIEQAYQDNNVELFFKKVDASSDNNKKAIYADNFRIRKLCNQQSKEEILLFCLKKAIDGGNYLLNDDDILSYDRKFGDSFLLTLLHERLISDSNMYDLLSHLTIDSKTPHTEIKTYYESRCRDLKGKFESLSYERIESDVKGRINISYLNQWGGIKREIILTGAIVEHDGKNVLVEYKEVTNKDVEDMLSLSDTYADKEKNYYKIMERVSQTPQNKNYFSGVVRKNDRTVTSYEHTYDVYEICYKGEEVACARYCNNDGKCSSEEGRTSKDSRNKLKELSGIFELLGISV